MSVHPFPPETLRREIEGLRLALQEVVQAVHGISQDVSDALVLQHIGEDLGRNHVELIVSLQGAAKKLQHLATQLEPKALAAG